eukprot:6461810-Amphidinium_carterae.1
MGEASVFSKVSDGTLMLTVASYRNFTQGHACDAGHGFIARLAPERATTRPGKCGGGGVPTCGERITQTTHRF